MKTIQRALFIGLITIAMATARAADNKAVTNDLAKLQGEWSMVSALGDGQPMPEAMLKQFKRICKGNETTTMINTQVFMKAKFTLDPSKKPKTIDYDMLDGLTKGKKHLGIYEVDGDTLKVCFSPPDAARPTDFTSTAGDHRTFTIWKREKKTAPKPQQK